MTAVTTRIARGDRVARSRSGYQHVARVIQPDGVVSCLCGNTLVGAFRMRLTGPACPTCLAIERGAQP